MSNKRKYVQIYTDGACKGNPGAGAYAAIIRYKASDGKEYTKEFVESFSNTTNNRMELLGVIVALESLNTQCKIDVYSDSQYIVNAFNNGWVNTWILEDWRKNKKNAVKNVDLWKRLLNAVEPHIVRWHWVKGHAGNPWNERCDDLASEAAKNESKKGK